jgi:hypothetical protein
MYTRYQIGCKWTRTASPSNTTQQKNVALNLVLNLVWKITNFDRQPALFNGVSMVYGGNYTGIF